jgi:thymidylate synthase
MKIYRKTISPLRWTLREDHTLRILKNAAENIWTEGREEKAEENCKCRAL